MNRMVSRTLIAACAEEPDPVVGDLARKDAFRVPLPDVPGAVAVDETVESRVRIALDADGSHVVKGRRVSARELAQKLLVYAERKRDLGTPFNGRWSARSSPCTGT